VYSTKPEFGKRTHLLTSDHFNPSRRYPPPTM